MTVTRSEAEQAEGVLLQPYALRSTSSRGRRTPEPQDPFRTCFARDRDRIVHSSAFRRLEYKTQVLLSGTGDHYRTRLTHSLEVAQTARSVAQALGLNATLVEAVALAHDLGHPPFAHSGEEELRALMQDHGGFEHNVQAVRIVDYLENPYPDRAGLNLCYETREALLKHGAEKAGALGRDFERHPHPSLEGQLVDLSDSIAYLSHDVDDGLRFGVFSVADLAPLEIWQRASLEARRRYPDALECDLLRPIVHQTLHLPILDLIKESSRCLETAAPKDPVEARHAPERLVCFSESMRRMQAELKRFLFEHFYRAGRVIKLREECRLRLRELFEHLVQHPEDMLERPDQVTGAPRSRYGVNAALPGAEEAQAPMLRRVCDYVAGMTDRFADSEHERLCNA